MVTDELPMEVAIMSREEERAERDAREGEDGIVVDVPAVVDEDGNVEPVVSKVTPEEADEIAEEENEEVQEARAWYTLWWVWLIIIVVFGFGFWGVGNYFWW